MYLLALIHVQYLFHSYHLSLSLSLIYSLSLSLQHHHEEALRLCLKHLRQYDYTEAYDALRKQAHLDLEHPLLTQLHSALVDRGCHREAEAIITKAAFGM